MLPSFSAYAITEISRIETELGSHFKVKLENKLPAIEKKMRRLGMLKDNTNANLKGTVFFRIKGKIHEEDPDVCVALQQKGHNRVSIKKTSKAKELSCKCHKTC